MDGFSSRFLILGLLLIVGQERSGSLADVSGGLHGYLLSSLADGALNPDPMAAEPNAQEDHVEDVKEEVISVLAAESENKDTAETDSNHDVHMKRMFASHDSYQENICSYDDGSDMEIRLPTNILPRYYHIDIFPKIYDDESDFKYDCETTILVDCIEDTNLIRLHLYDHSVQSISLVDVGPSGMPAGDVVEQGVHSAGNDKNIPASLMETQLKVARAAHAATNGTTNGTTHTATNGTTHTATNGTTYAVTNGTTHAATNGTTHNSNPSQNSPSPESHIPEKPSSNGKIDIDSCTSSRSFQTIDIRTKQTLKANRKYGLVIKSTNRIAAAPNTLGFYYAPYKDGNETKYIFTTMMEPTYARYVFPCFDEPAFKAVFTMSIKRKAHLTSVMNLPLSKTIGPDSEGYYIDVYDRPLDVPMSTYLVAFALGDFKYIETNVRNISVRFWSRPGILENMQYALNITAKFLEYFEEYFQIPFPLPKLDSVAVPDMGFSGMEHWGMVTYKEDKIMYEPGVTSVEFIQGLTLLTAHEIAHQWFGNLVSPYWWDDLWLNEGFATYMMFLAIEDLIPEWNMGNKLIVEPRGVQSVMKKDQTTSSHPVFVRVDHPYEIDRIFDLISYAKGGAVIRMMNFILGDLTFRNGLRKYLLRHSYSTATHDDLWAALTEQAHEDKMDVNVKSVMDPWLDQSHFPLVKLTIYKDNHTACFHQSAFLQSAEHRQQMEHTLWKIPVTYTTDKEANFDKNHTSIIWLNNRTVCVEDANLSGSSWVVVNLKQWGYFRVNYDVDNWQAIIQQLQTDHTVIHPINRAQIINDAYYLFKAGLLEFSIVRGILSYLHAEMEYEPWQAALQVTAYLDQTLQLSPTYGHFQHFMKAKLEAVYLLSHGSTDYRGMILHGLVAEHACRHLLPACREHSVSLFHSWSQDQNTKILPEIVDTVFCVAAADIDYMNMTQIVHQVRLSGLHTKQLTLLETALGCSQEPWVILSLLKTDWFSSDYDNFDLIEMVTSTAIGRILAWQFLVDEWSSLINVHIKRFALKYFKVEIYLETTLGSLTSRRELDRLKQFMASNDMSLWRNDFQSNLEGLVERVEFLEKYGQEILETNW